MDKSEFLVKLGERVAEIRKQKEMTQEQLADAIDVHRTYVGFIERGTRNPLIFNVYEIAKVLNLPVADLLRDL